MDAPETSRRRWWQSTEWNVLLVLALVVAIGLGWLGWQASIVRHRRAIGRQFETDGEVRFGRMMYASKKIVISPPPLFREIHPADPRCAVSQVRRLLGDQEVRFIEFWRPLTAADRQAMEAFPEAEVKGVADSPQGPGR